MGALSFLDKIILATKIIFGYLFFFGVGQKTDLKYELTKQ